MSTPDREHLTKLVKMLPESGKWRWVALIIAVPSVIGALTAGAAYLLATFTFLQGVNLAVRLTPSHDTAIQRIVTRQNVMDRELLQVWDTLRSEGYYLAPMP